MAKRTQRKTGARPKKVPRGTPPAPKRAKKAARVPGPDHIEVIARGLVWHGSKVLLCRNLKHGYLYLPGGHVDPGESAAAALTREFLEEGRLSVTVGRLGLVDEGTFDTAKRGHHEINLVFHVELAPTVKPAKVRSVEDGIALEWVEHAALPELDVRPLAHKAWLVGGGDAPLEWFSGIAQPASSTKPG
jgi:8-oxo-dGTP diphosphatase